MHGATKKGRGLFCRNGPKGAPHKINQVPFSFFFVAWWSFVAAIVSAVLVSWVTTPYDRERLRWWSFVAAIVSAVLVSWVTTPYDRERLRGLVCWIPNKEPTS